MKRSISYHRGNKPRASRADEEPEFYWPGERVGIEVPDHRDDEEWEDTGLLDSRGDPIWRIVRYVRPSIGFVLSNG